MQQAWVAPTRKGPPQEGSHQIQYPKWALDKVEKRLNRSTSEVIDGVNNQGTTAAQPVTNEVKNKGHIVIPYTQGLCEGIKKICGRYGIQTHFQGGRTIKSLLVSPKDKDPVVNQSDAIYWYQRCDLGCVNEYIGETSRTFGERYKEHPKAPSAIHHHSSQTGHHTNHNNFQIIGRERCNLARNIKETIYIRVNNPTLNNNIDKFNLPHIKDRVLLNTKGLNLKWQVNPFACIVSESIQMLKLHSVWERPQQSILIMIMYMSHFF